MPTYTESNSVAVVAQPSGEIEIVTTTTDLKDGEVVSRKKHTRVLAPGADLSGETPAVQAVARGIWTPAVVAPFTTEQQAAIAELAAKRTTLDADAAALATSQAALEADAAALATRRAAVEAELADIAAKEAEAAAKRSTVNGVPQSVTRRQARQALRLAGVLDMVQPAIDAIPDPMQRGLMQDEWDDSQTFERQRPALLQLAGALGLTSAQVDQLFVTAAGL